MPDSRLRQSRSRAYSVRGSVRKTAEFIGLSLICGGDIHYERWPEREVFLTRRAKPAKKRRKR